MKAMDEGRDRPPPSPSGTTLEGFGSVKGKSKGKSKGLGSVMDQGKGPGFGQPTLESLDSHDDYGKGKGKDRDNDRRALDYFFREWKEVERKGKGKGCGEPNYAELLVLLETLNGGGMGGSGAGEVASGSGK
jgi:hypothetical protein